MIEDVQCELDTFQHEQGRQASDAGKRGAVVVEDAIRAAENDSVLGLALELVAGPCEVELHGKLRHVHLGGVAVHVDCLLGQLNWEHRRWEPGKRHSRLRQMDQKVSWKLTEQAHFVLAARGQRDGDGVSRKLVQGREGADHDAPRALGNPVLGELVVDAQGDWAADVDVEERAQQIPFVGFS